MIEVSFIHLILVPLGFNLVILLSCYVYYTAVRFARGVRERRRRIYRCQVCVHVYVDDRDVPLARCPRCGCLNDAVRR
jgi:rRNA maturation endonuclease Nob1